MKKLKKFTILTIVLMLIFTVGCNSNGTAGNTEEEIEVPENAVARVGDKFIMQEDFDRSFALVKRAYNEYYGPEIWNQDFQGRNLENIVKENVLKSLINEEIVRNYVKENSEYEPTEEEIQKAYDEFMKQNEEDSERFKYYEENGIDEAFLKDEITGQLYSSKFDEMLNEEIKSDQEALDKLYDEKIIQVKAQHVLTKDEAKAKVALEKLKNGIDFAEIAKEYSQDPGTASNGGSVGYFGKGEMVPEFEKVAFDLEVGELSGIVESQFGYHVIKVNDKRTINDLIDSGATEETVEKYKQQVLNSKIQELYEAKLNNLNEKAEVEEYINFNKENNEEAEENTEG